MFVIITRLKLQNVIQIFLVLKMILGLVELVLLIQFSYADHSGLVRISFLVLFSFADHPRSDRIRFISSIQLCGSPSVWYNQIFYFYSVMRITLGPIGSDYQFYLVMRLTLGLVESDFLFLFSYADHSRFGGISLICSIQLCGSPSVWQNSIYLCSS